MDGETFMPRHGSSKVSGGSTNPETHADLACKGPTDMDPVGTLKHGSYKRSRTWNLERMLRHSSCAKYL